MHVVIIYAVLSFSLLNKLKLYANYLRIFLEYSLIVLYLIKSHFKLIRTRYESLSLALAYWLSTPLS